MKATYIKPETIIVMIQHEHNLLGESQVPVGETYNGEAVLSREGGSSWDDEE